MKVRAEVVLSCLLGASVGSSAQEQTAPPRQERAPREMVTATLNGQKVTVEYGRPALRGRTLEALLAQLPPDRVWRAGVDQATTLTTETDLLIGGQRVPAGTYSLYVHAPETGDWAVLLNSDRGVPLKTIFPAAPPELAEALWPRLDGYARIAGQEVARATLKPAAAAEPMERFLMSLDPARDGVSALNLTWGARSWTVEVKPAASP